MDGVEYVRSLADWGLVAYDLAHRAVIWDEQVAEVVGGDAGWRGADPDEVDRIVRIVTAALIAGAPHDLDRPVRAPSVHAPGLSGGGRGDGPDPGVHERGRESS